MRTDLIKIVKVGIVISILLFIIDQSYNFNVDQSFQFGGKQLLQLVYYIVYSIVLTAVNSYYFDYINKVSWAKKGIYQLMLRVLGSIFLTLLVVVLLRLFEGILIHNSSLNEFYANELKNRAFYLNIIRITLIISVVFHVFYYYNELQKKKVTEQKVIAGTASAQFDALKNQLDPHFLFNSLNVLTSLIDENPRSAQQFTTSLSKIYRYVLEQKNKELVTVGEELDFARTYINLLKMRFEDSILCDIPEKISNSDAKVVPLSLQLLLENAVKHNVVNPAKPLKISIYEKEGNLVVENNLQPKDTLKKGTGVGLINIRQRYGLLTHRKVTVNQSTTNFSVELPMLTKQIAIMKTQQEYIQDKRYERAKEKVAKIKGFYTNLLTYLIVIPFLVYLNFRTTDFPWVLFPIFGWGFGVTMHGMEAYGYNPILGKNWEQRKIREFMDED